MRHNILLSFRLKRGISLAFLCSILLFPSFFITPDEYRGAGLYAQSQNEQAADNADRAGAVKGGQENEQLPGLGLEDEAFGPRVDEGSAIWEIIKVIFVLGLFVGGFYFFYKFISQKVGLNMSGQEAIRTLSVVPVGPGKMLQIIDVAGRVYLIGVAESSINLLTEIKEKDDIDRIRLLSSRSTPVQGKNFQEFVADQVGWIVDRINEKRHHGARKAMVEEISEKEIDVSYLAGQKNRLKKMNGEDEK